MSNMIIIKPCDHFEKCVRIALIMDKDWLEQQKAELICDACESCKERVSEDNLR